MVGRSFARKDTTVHRRIQDVQHLANFKATTRKHDVQAERDLQIRSKTFPHISSLFLRIFFWSLNDMMVDERNDTPLDGSLS